MKLTIQESAKVLSDRGWDDGDIREIITGCFARDESVYDFLEWYETEQREREIINEDRYR